MKGDSHASVFLALALALLPGLAPADALNRGTANRSASFQTAPDFTRKPVVLNPRAPCGNAEQVKERLSSARWQEQPGGIGIMELGGVTRLAYLYRSPTGTWTVVTEDSNGIACIIASGTDWQVYSIHNGS